MAHALNKADCLFFYSLEANIFTFLNSSLKYVCEYINMYKYMHVKIIQNSNFSVHKSLIEKIVKLSLHLVLGCFCTHSELSHCDSHIFTVWHIESLLTHFRVTHHHHYMEKCTKHIWSFQEMSLNVFLLSSETLTAYTYLSLPVPHPPKVVLTYSQSTCP